MRDVHKTVLMHADVHEGAEGGHVGHHSLEHHAGLQVLHLLDAVGELRRAEFGTGITTGLQKFAKNVRHGRNAEVFVHEVAGMERTKHRRIADQRLDVQPRLLQDAKHNGIGLGMHGGGVKRIVAVGNAKEAKDHGEGGVIVGAPLKGKVVIIDDVISAGTSVRESVKIIQANGAVPSGVLIALDRQERGGNAVEMTETSAVQDVEKTLGMNVASIICLNDLLAFMNGDTDMAKAVSCHKEAVAAYRARYGA